MENSKKELNLMMVAAHHRQVYERFIASQIEPSKLKELNDGIQKSIILLSSVRKTIFDLQYHGKYFTMIFGNGLAQKIDGIIEEINKSSRLVNQTESTINLADYPLK